MAGRPNPVADVVRFIRSWGTTGAVAPSGKALARRMASQIDPSGTLPVLELGPGTGVVTEALVERGIAPERIVAVEYNPDFCRLLQERFPTLRLVQGDAYDLEATLTGSYGGPFAGVVSSLPLLLREPRERRALVLDALRRLAPGGVMVQFSYSPKPPVPVAPGDYALAGSPFVLRNIPPARVWTYRPNA
jgi:phosphatidylethanolamine/phosphatidyl-N-methylethanolamine N-methyltransferase